MARNHNTLKAHVDMGDMVVDRFRDSNIERAGHDVEQPLMADGRDVEVPGAGYTARLLYKKPAETLKWLEQCGVRKLGNFMVQDNTVHRLLDRDGMLTLGTDDRDVDWEAMWRTELARDDGDPANDARTAAMDVEAFIVSIEHPADADEAGLVNPLLHCYQNCIFNVNVWALPAVQATITYKWNCWAKRHLFIELGLYLTWLIAFQVFVLLFQDEDTKLSLVQLVQEPHGITTVVFEIVSTLGMLPFVYIEACAIKEYGLRGWLDFWRIVDLGAYGLQIAIVFMHLSRAGVDSNELSVIMAIQVLLLWIKVQYYARVLQPTKNPFVDTLKAVLNDVKWFLFLLLITMFGFSVAFNILYRRDPQKEQFRTIGASFTTTFDWLMGGVDFTIFKDTHNPQVGVVLLLLYWFSMSMVLLNCLIAIMADACTRVSENQAARFMAGRAEIIDELESSLPAWLRRRTMSSCYPTYIHFIKVNKRSADPSMSSAAAKDDEAEQRMDDLEAQVKRIAAIQEALAKKLLDKATYDALPFLKSFEPDDDD